MMDSDPEFLAANASDLEWTSCSSSDDSDVEETGDEILMLAQLYFGEDIVGTLSVRLFSICLSGP